MFKNAQHNLEKFGTFTKTIRINFNEGPAKGVLFGEERCSNAKWDPAQRSNVFCKKENGGRFIFAMPFWDGQDVRILEGGQRLYKTLNDIAKGIEISDHVIEIERQGEREKTTYQVTILKELDNAMKEKVRNLELPAFSQHCRWLEGAPPNQFDKSSPEPASASEAFGEDKDSQIPF